MSHITVIQQQLAQIHTVEDLTEAFEGIASIHIAKIRDRVVASKDFFSLLWPIYRSLRVDKDRLIRSNRAKAGRNVFLVVTSEGKLASEIVEKIVGAMIEAYGKVQNTDIMVVGSRGVEEVHRHGLPIIKSFAMPTSDVDVNVSDIIHELNEYEQISVFYQTYESLRTQAVARIELVSAVQSLGENVGQGGETLSSKDYIFEPSINEIADYMESVMMGVALIQVVMESKLAGHAARFNAMSRAKRRARELSDDFRLEYHRAKRSIGDERLKEIMKVVRTNEYRRAD
jgi:F-type H+-transporting ATPase subunit gamma